MWASQLSMRIAENPRFFGMSAKLFHKIHVQYDSSTWRHKQHKNRLLLGWAWSAHWHETGHPQVPSSTTTAVTRMQPAQPAMVGFLWFTQPRQTYVLLLIFSPKSMISGMFGSVIIIGSNRRHQDASSAGRQIPKISLLNSLNIPKIPKGLIPTLKPSRWVGQF